MKKRKFKETIIGIVLLFFALMFISELFIGLVYGILIGTGLINIKINKDFVSILENYFILIIPLIVVIAIIALSKNDKYMLKKFSLKNNKLLPSLAIGFVINTICVIVAILTNSLELKFNYLNLPLLLFAIIAVAIQCAYEEVLCRLYLYQKLNKNYNKKIALIVNSIIFGLLHIFNDGMTIIGMISIIGFGFLMTMYVYCYDDLWGAIGIHTSWNFTQNLIYGMPNSGLLPSYSLFKVVNSKSSLTYNPIFGIEGTIFTIIIVVLTSILIYMYSKRKKSEEEIKIL